MLIQSWGDRIRIFPAVRSSWDFVVFRDLRAEGSFLVSAVRKGGKTQWVHVKSLASKLCRIAADFAGEVKTTTADECRGDCAEIADGVYELDLNAGSEATVFSGDESPPPKVTPSSRRHGEGHSFGLRGEES